jgi:hypothetical protein
MALPMLFGDLALNITVVAYDVTRDTTTLLVFITRRSEVVACLSELRILLEIICKGDLTLSSAQTSTTPKLELSISGGLHDVLCV